MTENISPLLDSSDASVSDFALIRYIEIADIVQDASLQVRVKLSESAIGRYASTIKSGGELPPVSLADVGGKLFLVDGWHRISAHRQCGQKSISATVSEMSMDGARWAAADANRRHGVQLKTSELRNVFNVYINTGRHRLGKGRYQSYRDLGAEFGLPFSTIRNWMKKDHPGIYERMGGSISTEGNPEPFNDAPDPQPGYLMRAKAAANDAFHMADLLACPVALGEAIAVMERRLYKLKSKPHEPYTDPLDNPNF